MKKTNGHGVPIPTDRQGVVIPYGRRPFELMKLLQSMPPIAERMLLALEIECMRHGGKNNGKIIQTYDDFELHGIRRKSVNRVIKLLVQSGIIKKKSGRPGIGGYERPNLFWLTYWPTWKGRKCAPPTNEWLKYVQKAGKRRIPVVVKTLLRGRSGQNATTGVQKAGNGQIREVPVK
jgi:hypothetical protein